MQFSLHRLASFVLASSAAMSAVAAPQTQNNPAPPPTAQPEQPNPAPPGANDESRTITPGSYLFMYSDANDRANTLRAITQATGARATFISSSGSIVLTGTASQLAKATAMIDELTSQAKERYERAKASEQAAREKSEKPKEASLPMGQITLDFPGGSAAQYVDAVGKAADFESFLTQDKSLLALIQVPPVKLNNVALPTAIEALTKLYLAGTDGAQYAISISWIGPASQFGRPYPGAGSGSDDSETLKRFAQSICVIQATKNESDARSATRAVFDLSSLGNGNKEEVQRLLDAVSIAVELDGKSATFRAKYHEPSQFLIVRGTKEELALVRQVLKARLPDFREDASPEAAKQPAPEQAPPPNPPRRGSNR